MYRPSSEGEGGKTAVDIDRTARAAFDKLKEALQGQPPWSKEVEVHRQKARNCYLSLLFAHPLSTYAQSLEPLWHQTTYSLITSYRSATAQREAELPAPTGKRAKYHSTQHTELTKVLTRFRQVLVSEDTFYRSLISRLVGFYQLQHLAQAHLLTLGINVPVVIEGGGPNEGLAPEMGSEEKREKLGLVYKASICLGDLERYKEQYDDRARREMREGRMPLNRLQESFGKAQTYYEVARALVPDDGSAFNQLAVISTYLNDDLLIIYYYLRALAVKHAFKNINEITEKYLRKIYERWAEKQKSHRKVQADSGEEGAVRNDKDEVVAFKADMLVVVAILFRRIGLSSFGKIREAVLGSLDSLLRTRQLPSEIIVKLTGVIIGVHWSARQAASVTTSSHDRPDQLRRQQEAEVFALETLLGVFGAMLTVSADEVDEALLVRSQSTAVVNDGEEVELYQYISAVLRRILPSLRILSKWLKVHLDYLSRLRGAHTAVEAIDKFWNSYKRLVLGLAMLFPIDQLPNLGQPLEEDVDMKGFIPLLRGMSGSRDSASGVAHNEAERGDGDVHPNEEQLMRIADLQVDAKLLAQIASGSSQLTSGGVMSMTTHGSEPHDLQRHDGDIASVSTETEDDPVNMAMRATLGGTSLDGESKHSDDEVIMWGNEAASALQNTVYTPPVPVAPLPTKPQTAFDLLQNLILDPAPAAPSAPSTAVPRHASFGNTAATPRRESPNRAGLATPGSPGLLFGGEKGSTIWAMTREESDREVRRAAVPSANLASIWGDQPSSVQHSPKLNTGGVGGGMASPLRPIPTSVKLSSTPPHASSPAAAYGRHTGPFAGGHGVHGVMPGTGEISGHRGYVGDPAKQGTYPR